jgi:hypothetical protein
MAGIKLLISGRDLFVSSLQESLDTINDAFLDDLGLTAREAVKTLILPPDTNIERIALEHLGDLNRWVEIVELNDLRAPFITQDPQDTRSNILKPGDSFLIPQPIINGFSEVPNTLVNHLTKDLDVVEKSLGVDFEVTKEFDLVLSNSGDISLVAGVQNLAQAIVLKLGYEKGELIEHPSLGVGVQVGSKFKSLENIRDSLLKTISQDSRIASVQNVALRRKSSSLYMTFEILVKQVDQPVPIEVKL